MPRIKKITVASILGPDIMRKAGEAWIKQRVKAIKSGRVIKIPYASSTKIKRRRYGLAINNVDLTGNQRYSRKGWRLLDQIIVTKVTRRSVEIGWRRAEAERIYGYQVRRYSKIL